MSDGPRSSSGEVSRDRKAATGVHFRNGRTGASRPPIPRERSVCARGSAVPKALVARELVSAHTTLVRVAASV